MNIQSEVKNYNIQLITQSSKKCQSKQVFITAYIITMES